MLQINQTSIKIEALENLMRTLIDKNAAEILNLYKNKALLPIII